MFDVNNRTGKKRTKIAQFIFTIMVFLSYILNYDISNEIIKSRNFIYPVITQVLILVFEVPSLGQISCLTVQLEMVWVLVGSSTNKIYSNINNVHASIINEEYHRTVFCLFFFFCNLFIQVEYTIRTATKQNSFFDTQSHIFRSSLSIFSYIITLTEKIWLWETSEIND